MNATRTCPQCRQPVGSDAPDGLCPECLLQVGLGTVPEREGTIRIGEEAVRERELPAIGARFGGYRIVRELGRGGMGAVYEAEHLESGRRIALKVLSHQLDSMADRARFLREGRLAGSINHPNSVYVFGTEEIEDTPVIAMELIAGGTLQERVQRSGPLGVGEAVDAILQVIAGLEAAQAIGILHRDIKPANCFQDADGTVKVGDFGLSISTAARGDTNLTMHGQFLGTPAFCSPEQLRGEELNVRSDMYSVGVTLFFLLTGRTPFEGRNMVQLLANVIEKPAPSPRKLRPEVPPGLASLVLRCLNKQPAERFKTYDELRQALAPFSSDAPVPAPVAMRFVAGMIDTLSLSLVTTAATLGVMGLDGLSGFANPASHQSTRYMATMAIGLGVSILYYAVFEGRWGRGLGKTVCRLRVVGPDRNPPGIGRALLRAMIVVLLPQIPLWLSYGLVPVSAPGTKSQLIQQAMIFSYYVLLALLFSTVRRRNGFAAVQDLATRTRVIRKPAHQARPVLAPGEDAPPVTGNRPTVGPFHIIESLGNADEGEWLLGYDTRLLRKVWIHMVPAGAPPLAPSMRTLGRVGRLRWISGRRSATENWDVFEGVTGAPLVKLSAEPQLWTRVRFWLFDLATEIHAAEKDGTLPAVLDPDRVWITADGRAKLLDFPAPGIAAEPAAASSEPPVRAGAWPFLAAVANVALSGRAADGTAPPMAPLPLHARAFLEQLPALPNAGSIAATMKPLLQRAATVSRLRRAALVGGCLAFPIIAAVGMMFGMRIYTRWQNTDPQITELAQVLNFRATVRMPWMRNNVRLDEHALGIYIANRFRGVVTNAPQWTSPYAMATIAGESRVFAERSVAENPNPSPPEVRAAEASLKDMRRALSRQRKSSFATQPWFPPLVFLACLIIYVALPALVAALCFRGGLVLRACGLAVARSQGAPASRGRVLWRALIAWAPVLLAPLLLAGMKQLTGNLWMGAGLLAFLAASLALVSVVLRGRGLPDRLAGTWLVPR